MREQMQEWTPYLAALGVALWAAALILFLLGTASPSILLGLVALGVFFVALYLINRPQEVRAAATGRTAIYGSNVLLMSLAFIGIVAVGNILLQRSLHQRVDVTAGKTNTLSEQTINVLKGLKDPVTVTGFFAPGSFLEPTFSKEIQEYQYYTDKISYRKIDPYSNPAMVQQYDVAQTDTVVFERGSGPNSRREKVYAADESTLTNALLKATQGQQQAIYFTTGHGELSITDTSQQGLDSLRNALSQSNYKVDSLNLAVVTNTTTISGTSPVSGSLPADTSAVVIAGPSRPFPAGDAARIKDYLDHGGRVLVLLDLGTDPGLKDLFDSYGIIVHNDLVVDQASYAMSPAIPAILQFPSHDVTRNLERSGVFFPGARAVTAPANPVPGRSPVELFKTSSNSCGKDYNALKSSGAQQIPPCDTSKDEKGPLSLGIAEEVPASSGGTAPSSRLVVIGNVTFVTNAWMGNQNIDTTGNQQLLSNIINWLAGQEQLIAIPPRQQQTPQLGLITGSDESLILWSNILILPVATLLLGSVIWWRRR